MIIDFSIDFNSYEEKILNKYKIFTYVCPKCGTKHALYRHGTYVRNISYYKNKCIVNEKLKVLRLKCASCNSTHAILPKDIIPYCIYTYSCIMKILYEHFNDKKSVLSIAFSYGISFQLIYLFIKLFNIFLKDCIYVLRTINLWNDILNPHCKDVIKIISHLKDQFPQIYLSKTK
mgnify:CR=1 FL=1